jgi:hypothetical protein
LTSTFLAILAVLALCLFATPSHSLSQSPEYDILTVSTYNDSQCVPASHLGGMTMNQGQCLNVTLPPPQKSFSILFNGCTPNFDAFRMSTCLGAGMLK